MFDVILAIDKNRGIGNKGVLPWRCLEDLKLFKEKTMNSILIVGRKTYDTLPTLKGREIYVVTRDSTKVPNRVVTSHKLDDYIFIAQQTGKKVFVAGGAQIYNQVLFNKSLREQIETIHISVMKDVYDCDTYIVNSPFENCLIKRRIEYDEFTHYELKPVQNDTGEIQYLNILRKIAETGIHRDSRNAFTLSRFVENMKFDLREGFPLLTTKKMFFRGIVEELLFFLRGETNTLILEQNNVNVWKGNTNRKFLDSIGKQKRPEGEMGPMYGYQWRHFNAPYDEENSKCLSSGIDQLASVVDMIKSDPYSRRILMTDYNPEQADEGVLYPCHSIVLQFYVDGDFLDMFCYNRSQDFFLGNPFNIASSSLLLSIIAKMTCKIARFFHLTMGDAHIYSSHIGVVKEQLTRTPYVLPKLVINKNLSGVCDINDLEYTDFELVGYQSYSSLKAEMIA